MVFTGVVNTTQTIQTLLRFEKVKQEQGLGLRILENTIMLLMVNMEVCGEPVEEFQVSYVD